MEQDEMGNACGMHGGVKKGIQCVGGGTCRKETVAHTGINVRIIFK
jgi:hypothetical protein